MANGRHGPWVEDGQQLTVGDGARATHHTHTRARAQHTQTCAYGYLDGSHACAVAHRCASQGVFRPSLSAMSVFDGNPYDEGPDASSGLLLAVGDSEMSILSVDGGSVLLQEVRTRGVLCV